MVAVTCTWLLFLTAISQVAVLVYSQTCSSFCGVCLDCEGNFRDLADVIPVFPRPTVNDQPINPPDNTLQFMGNDVLGCNEVQSQIFYYDDDCNLLEVPGDNIIYATLSNIQGRNLFNQNEANWDTIEGHVLNVTVQCQNQLRFCVLFGLGINGSVVVPTNSSKFLFAIIVHSCSGTGDAYNR